MKPRAVVFAYHDVGSRCLRVLSAYGIDICLVVTHDDDPNENIWFEKVDDVAKDLNLITTKPTSDQFSSLAEKIKQIAPDFIFSFYYRFILPNDILQLAKYGAFNLHGSLLPHYRGRSPVNWAILKGETQTGVSLHEMVAKPDAGDIATQISVPILPDDTAYDVFQKIKVAAEQALCLVLPKLVDRSWPRLPNRINEGSYFGGRKPADGLIDCRQPAQTIYNLIRAVAPPFPGAFLSHKLYPHLPIIAAKARLYHLPIPVEHHEPGLHMINQKFVIVGSDQRGVIIHQFQDSKQRVLERSEILPYLVTSN